MHVEFFYSHESFEECAANERFINDSQKKHINPMHPDKINVIENPKGAKLALCECIPNDSKIVCTTLSRMPSPPGVAGRTAAEFPNAIARYAEKKSG